MFWNRMFSFVLGGGLMVARPLAGGLDVPVKLGEILSYDCARAVSGLGVGPRPPGPLFREGDLVFASIETSAHQPELMISAGAGIFTLELSRLGLNRLRFDLISADGQSTVTYYLTYLHDARLGSRYLEFSADRPPVGHLEFDYLAVIPVRAEYLTAHLDYASFETSQNLTRAAHAGRIAAGAAPLVWAGACDHLTRENPKLARELKSNLNEFAVLVARDLPGRMPASLR